MDKELFTEQQFAKNIPREIMEIIDALDPQIPQRIYDHIFGSEELVNFENSISLPEVEFVEKRRSILLDDVKERIKPSLKREKS